MIHILLPTIRPETANKTMAFWIDKAVNRNDVLFYVNVNTGDQLAKIEGSNIVRKLSTSNDRPGSVYKFFVLSRSLIAQDSDIVIAGSDDVFPMDAWDEAIKKEFDNFDGCLLVNDKWTQIVCPREYEAKKPFFIPIPILTGSCLRKCNGVIFHPAYFHNWADAEFMDKIVEMGLLKNIMYDKPEVYFEHKHYSNGGRARDEADIEVAKKDSIDNGTYYKRKKMTLAEKLVV